MTAMYIHLEKQSAHILAKIRQNIDFLRTHGEEAYLARKYQGIGAPNPPSSPDGGPGSRPGNGF
jgi:hypothetical protein